MKSVEWFLTDIVHNKINGVDPQGSSGPDASIIYEDSLGLLGPVSPTTVNFNRRFSSHFYLQLA